MVANGLRGPACDTVPRARAVMDNRCPTEACLRMRPAFDAPVRRSVATRRRALLASALLAAALTPPAAGADAAIEEIVVTATRRPVPALETPLSLGVVGRDAIELVGSTHHAETMNRIAGVMIQRGSGQESLTAIRSPVLAGAGACGGFLFLENDIPIRPTGFCNVNELMEVNTEQAQAIEVLRGPGTALYGSNALHGLVNVRQASPAQRPARFAGVDAGPADYGRLRLAGRLDHGAMQYGAAALYAHDGGWRDHSGYDEAKLNLSATGGWRDTPLRMDLSATWLEQDTAGFILGQGAYRIPSLRVENLNPEAYRDASSVRLTGLLAPPLESGARLELRPYLRSSRMEFLQHFLLGQPLERNGQASGGLMSTITWDADPDRILVAGLDLEIADSFLRQYQDGPTTGGSPPANAIRPAGWHYDYDVRSYVAAGYLHGERRFAGRWRATAGVRAEWVTYDYDNAMIAGNTDDNGVPCTPAGCLYSRPADRSDGFFNVAPKLSLAVNLRDELVAYVNGSVGFRPPEITELYRLQRAQRVAELDSERLDALEIGMKGGWPALGFELALFDMRKYDVILRESNGNNVSGGTTSHRGVEYLLRWRALDGVELVGSGTFAQHRYEFSRNIEGGERIVDGNEIDTAPERIYRAALEWQPTATVGGEAEWLVVGPYFLDASNEHGYTGHGLLNLRARWRATPEWAFTLRLNNALDRYYADRADYAFGDYRYFPGRGRALFAEIAWTRE
jgi:outer membrane receptor protein involved in Fe transport